MKRTLLILFAWLSFLFIDLCAGLVFFSPLPIWFILFFIIGFPAIMGFWANNLYYKGLRKKSLNADKKAPTNNVPQMSFTDSLVAKITPIDTNTLNLKGLTTLEKETIIVSRIQQSDMLSFTHIPFKMNCPITKNMNGHPIAYMKIKEDNKKIAVIELEKLNYLIYFTMVSYMADIPFLQMDPRLLATNDDGISPFSKLICSPYDLSGTPSKTPLTFLFFSHKQQLKKWTWNGNITYSVDGTVHHASIHFWQRVSYDKPSDGWHFTFQHFDSELKLARVQKNNVDDLANPIDVYVAQEIILQEQIKATNKENYEWLLENLPNICPKSFNGYMRGKSSNSLKYQRLTAEAEKLGKKL